MSTSNPTTPYDILHGLFAWGSGDIDYVCREMDAFEVDPGDVGEYLEEWLGDIGTGFEGLTAGKGVNSVLYAIHEVALSSVNFDWQHTDRLERFYNCIDTHLSVKDDDGEYIECYDLADLKAAVVKLQHKTTDDEYNEDDNDAN